VVNKHHDESEFEFGGRGSQHSSQRVGSGQTK
jgi:hypothetical protein